MSPGRLRFYRYLPTSPRVFYLIAIRTLATVLMAV